MKKAIYWLIVLVLAGLLTACQKGTPQNQTSDKNVIWLYYSNPAEDGFVKVDYVLTNPEDIEKSVSEVLFRLSDTEEDNTNRYKALLQGIIIEKTVIQDGNVNIDFGEAYYDQTNIQEALMRAAVVKSLIQIEGVDSVSFSVNGADLLGSDEMPAGLMTKDTFLIEGENEVNEVDQTVTLYYSNEEGTKLVPVKKRIVSKSNKPIEQQALEELCKSPESTDKKGYISPLPVELRINQIQILDNVCYIDLSKEIEKVVPGVEEEVTIYSMVNTLTALNSAYQIQFTIDGKKRNELNNIKDFGNVFSANPELNVK